MKKKKEQNLYKLTSIDDEVHASAFPRVDNNARKANP